MCEDKDISKLLTNLTDEEIDILKKIQKLHPKDKIRPISESEIIEGLVEENLLKQITRPCANRDAKAIAGWDLTDYALKVLNIIKKRKDEL